MGARQACQATIPTASRFGRTGQVAGSAEKSHFADQLLSLAMTTAVPQLRTTAANCFAAMAASEGIVVRACTTAA